MELASFPSAHNSPSFPPSFLPCDRPTMAKVMQTARKGVGGGPPRRQSPECGSSKRRAEEDVKPKVERNVKPKVERDVKPTLGEDVKPRIEEDVKPTTSTVKDAPLDWLKFTPPEDLQKLLLQGCSFSPSFNALVASSIAKLAPLSSGQGNVEDFKEDVVEITTQLRNWSEGEIWPEIVENVKSISRRVKKKSPLLSKLDALRALAEVISFVPLLQAPFHLSTPPSSLSRIGCFAPDETIKLS